MFFSELCSAGSCECEFILDHDPIQLNLDHGLAFFVLSMILPENRFPLFGIMLQLFRPTASTCFVMDAARVESWFSYSIEDQRIDPTECLAVSPHRECRPPLSRAPRCDHRGGAADGERRWHGGGADRRCRGPRRHRGGHGLSLFPGEERSRRRALGGVADDEIGALRSAAAGAPGPLGPVGGDHDICRARLRDRRLSFAAIAEPIDAELDTARVAFRKSLAAEFAGQSLPRSPRAACRSRMSPLPRPGSPAC